MPDPRPRCPEAYGRWWAAVYDEVHADLQAEVLDAVALLLTLAGMGGRVLELGVGTGRLAIPLARAGLRVVGLDISADMLRILQGKPGGDLVAVVRGDMVDPPLAGPFDVVLCAFNGLFGLPDAATQTRCIAAAARLLDPVGHLVLDSAVPQPWRLRADDHDPDAQTVTSTHAAVVAGRLLSLPLALRYVWPEELDAMAAAAGLSVAWRRPEWDGSGGHDGGGRDAAARLITVYGPAAPGAAAAGVGRP